MPNLLKRSTAAILTVNVVATEGKCEAPASQKEKKYKTILHADKTFEQFAEYVEKQMSIEPTKITIPIESMPKPMPSNMIENTQSPNYKFSVSHKSLYGNDYMHGVGDLLISNSQNSKDQQDNVLATIEDLIGDAIKWPIGIRNIFLFNSKWGNADRVKIATFFIGNGCPPFLIEKWMHLTNVITNPLDKKNMINLMAELSTFDKNSSRICGNYFYRDMEKDMYCWMDGSPHIPKTFSHVLTCNSLTL